MASADVIGASALHPSVNNMASGFAKMCRTCAACTDSLMPIFTGEGLLNNLADKIHRHLPIRVSEQDRLPQQLCHQCSSTLLAWHELVKCCTQADAALRVRLQRLQEQAHQENGASVKHKVATAAAQPAPVREQEPICEQEHKCDETEKIELGAYLEDALGCYTRDAANVVYVCQKCDHYSPAHSVEALAKHLLRAHRNVLSDATSLAAFVTENLILVETLDESHVVGEEKASTPEDALQRLCCPFCQKIFSSARRLIAHIGVHEEVSASANEGFGCRCCDVSCADGAALVEHLQREHVVVEMVGGQQPCRSCGHVAESMEDLAQHVAQEHTGASTARNASTKRSGLKFSAVECGDCGKSVSNKYNLIAHAKRHLRNERWKCGVCERAYRSKGALKSHEDVAHGGKLPHVCPHCGEAFSTKMQMGIHARLHTGETPFGCDTCGKYFRSKNSLVVHVKVHLNVRAYACTRCPATFRKLTHLKYHTGAHERRDRRAAAAVVADDVTADP